MLRVKVGLDTKLEQRPTKSGGFFTNQSIWVFTPGAEYPIKIVIVIPLAVAQVGGYQPGEYILDLDLSVDQGRFKSVDLGFEMSLIPFSENIYIRKIALLQIQMQEHSKAYVDFLEKTKFREAAELQAVNDMTTSVSQPVVAPVPVKKDYGLKSAAAAA